MLNAVSLVLGCSPSNAIDGSVARRYTIIIGRVKKEASFKIEQKQRANEISFATISGQCAEEDRKEENLLKAV